jgi:hypothetical protein
LKKKSLFIERYLKDRIAGKKNICLMTLRSLEFGTGAKYAENMSKNSKKRLLCDLSG